MSAFSALLIGHESLTRQCGQMLLDRGHRISAVVTRNAEVRKWAQGAGLRVEAAGDWAALAGLSVVTAPTPLATLLGTHQLIDLLQAFPAAWTAPDGSTWLFATAKEGDKGLVLYDGDTGATLRDIGSVGPALGQFDRPQPQRLRCLPTGLRKRLGRDLGHGCGGGRHGRRGLGREIARHHSPWRAALRMQYR